MCVSVCVCLSVSEWAVCVCLMVGVSGGFAMKSAVLVDIRYCRLGYFVYGEGQHYQSHNTGQSTCPVLVFCLFVFLQAQEQHSFSMHCVLYYTHLV